MSEPQTTYYEDIQAALRGWRRRTMALLWLAYASFYLCRVNLAAAQKSLGQSQKLSESQLGGIIAAMKVCYACGQLANGFLTDRLGTRVLAASGLAASAGLNLIFSRLQSYRAMVATWAVNGYCQACGWTPTVRTIANWYPPRLRDGASGWIGTSYILGSAMSWVLAGRLTDALGWRAAFWVPAIICALVAITHFLFIRQRPEDVGLPATEQEPLTAQTTQVPVRGRLLSRQLVMLGTANTVFVFGYHGVLDWTPHYLAQAGALTATAAAEKASLMQVGGVLSCLALAFLARRRSRPMSTRAVLLPLLLMGVLTYTFPRFVSHSPGLVPPVLIAMGGLTAAPATLVACAMAANCGGAQAAGAAAGIVDAMGYAGSALSGLVSGKVIAWTGTPDGQALGWDLVWKLWAAGIAIGGIMVRFGAKPRPEPAREGQPRV